jgi:hypothetical protein
MYMALHLYIISVGEYQQLRGTSVPAFKTTNATIGTFIAVKTPISSVVLELGVKLIHHKLIH